jgi:lipid II:glycine glycyltransferase (peptidoglycan interpeptide bridge formation enzyme)
LFKEIEFLLASFEAIDKHYRNKGYIFLSVQLAIPTGNMADLIEYRLNKSLKIRTYFNRDNWSSIVLDLTMPEESIRSNFSKGHKSDLKKVEKNQISVGEPDSDEFDKFCQLYVKMFKERGLPVDDRESLGYFGRVHDFLKRTGRGRILVVKDGTGQVLGGIILLFQGGQVRYFKGASDPAFRQIPVLHLALWEGIKKARAMGYRQFDFWGYNHFVTEKDQVFFINRFKKGFGGKYSFYPKKMYVLYKPLVYRLYILLTSFQKKLSK